MRSWRGPTIPFIGNPQYVDGVLFESTDAHKGPWPSSVLKKAYRGDTNADAQQYEKLAKDAFRAATDSTVQDVKGYFCNRGLQEFIKKEVPHYRTDR